MAQPTQLTPTEQDALVKQIGLAMLRVAPDDWEQLTVDYRAVGRYAESTGQVSFADGSAESWEMPADLRGLFARLRAGMYREGRGTWFNARYRLDHPSSYNLEYDRDEPGWDMPPPPQAYPDDIRMFPRTDENVPEWLRRRLASAPPPPGPPGPPSGGPPTPRFRVARIFDGPGEDGRPSVNRPPVDEMDIGELLDYLDNAPLVGPARGYDVDRLDPNGQQSVPVAFHTDGTWIWPAAVNYYLREHDISPETDLVDHVRRMRFKVPQVDEQTRSAAQLFLAPPMPPGPGPAGPGPGPGPAGVGPAGPGPGAGPGPAGPAGPRPGPPAPAPTRALPVPAPSPPRAALPSQGPPSQQIDHLRARLDDLDVPETAYQIGPPTGRGWVMEPTDDGWRVGWHDREWVAPAMFEDVADASAFLLGKLMLDTDRWAAGPKNPELPPPPPLAAEDHGFEPLSAPIEAFEPMSAPIEEFAPPAHAAPAAHAPGHAAPAGPLKPPPGTPGYTDYADSTSRSGGYGDSPGGRSGGYGDSPGRGFTEPSSTPGYGDSPSGYSPGYGDSPGRYSESPDAAPPRPGPPPGTPPRPKPAPTMAMEPPSRESHGLDSPPRGFDSPAHGDSGAHGLDTPSRGFEPAHGHESSGLDSPPRGIDLGTRGSSAHGLDSPARGMDSPAHGLASGRGLDSGRGPDSPSHGLDSGRGPDSAPHGFSSDAARGLDSGRGPDSPGHSLDTGRGFDSGRGSDSPGHGFDSDRGFDSGRGPDAPAHGLDSSRSPDAGRGFDSGRSPDSPGHGLDSSRGPDAGRGFDSGRGPDAPAHGLDSSRGPDANRGFDSSRSPDSPGHGLDSGRGFEPGHGADSGRGADGGRGPDSGRGSDAPGRGHDPGRGADGRGGDSPSRGDQATVLASRPTNGAAAAPAGSEWPITPLPGEPPLTLFRGKRVIELEPGMEIDRFGEDDGNLVYAAGTPFSERSLVPEWVERPYHVYRVRQPVQALTGAAIPWFDQPGGGTAYLLPDAIGDLVAHGHLVEVNDRERPPA